jgi:hypothetical protein
MLVKIQSELKAPKNQFNKFGNYNYRSAEDILEAVKPLLSKYNCQMTISDEILCIGQRIYVKATVTFTEGEKVTTVSAFAREEETKKGMDAAQITGSASSYARKYALNGMFLIDDTKDPDATNKHGKEDERPVIYWTEEAVKAAIESAKTNQDLVIAWNNASPEHQQSLKLLFAEKKKEL